MHVELGCIKYLIIVNTLKLCSMNLIQFFLVSSLHAITIQEKIVINEPITSNKVGISYQIMKPAIIAPGTDKYLIGARTIASPYLNA